MARSKEAQEAHEKIMQTMKEYQERLDNMTPEERAKEERILRSMEKWLYPRNSGKGKTEET